MDQATISRAGSSPYPGVPTVVGVNFSTSDKVYTYWVPEGNYLPVGSTVKVCSPSSGQTNVKVVVAPYYAPVGQTAKRAVGIVRRATRAKPAPLDFYNPISPIKHDDSLDTFQMQSRLYRAMACGSNLREQISNLLTTKETDMNTTVKIENVTLITAAGLNQVNVDDVTDEQLTNAIGWLADQHEKLTKQLEKVPSNKLKTKAGNLKYDIEQLIKILDERPTQ